MMVAPEREVPGTMASTWPKPIRSAATGPISGTDAMVGGGRSHSIRMMATPPTISAIDTTNGLNSTEVM